MSTTSEVHGGQAPDPTAGGAVPALEATGGTRSGRKESPARRRILDAATGLFYAEGIHTVGIDRIIAEATVAKATFYHHFPAKDDLVCAYLSERSQIQRVAARSLDSAGLAPVEALLTVFDVIGELSCGPGFRGCAFVNAAAEYADPDHPVRLVVTDHRTWFRGLLRDLLVKAGHADAERTSGMLLVLRDGLVVAGYLDDPAEVKAGIRAAVTRLLNH